MLQRIECQKTDRRWRLRLQGMAEHPQDPYTWLFGAHLSERKCRQLCSAAVRNRRQCISNKGKHLTKSLLILAVISTSFCSLSTPVSLVTLCTEDCVETSSGTATIFSDCRVFSPSVSWPRTIFPLEAYRTNDFCNGCRVANASIGEVLIGRVEVRKAAC